MLSTYTKKAMLNRVKQSSVPKYIILSTLVTYDSTRPVT